MSDNLKIGVLVSGRGSNLQVILDQVAQGKIKVEVRIVISNRPDVQALVRAKKAGVPSMALPKKTGESREDYDKRLVDTLKKHDVQLVVLAGYMRLISNYFISQFPDRILNIHPSLLPAFPGLNVHQRVLEAGVRYSGCTVHLVDDGCDTGPIIAQAVVPVLASDTAESLAARILEKEHEILPKAIDLFAQNKVKIEGRRVLIQDH